VSVGVVGCRGGWLVTALVLVLAGAGLAACGDDDDDDAPAGTAATDGAAATTAGAGATTADETAPVETAPVVASDDPIAALDPACGAAPMALSSPAFADGAPIPADHLGDVGNLSPPLAWSCAPAGTRLVLVVDDVDAPGGSFIHWNVLALRDAATGAAESTGSVPIAVGDDLLTEGTTDAGAPGWIGPLPPPGSGPHRYVFTLYAVAGATLPTDAATTADELLAAIDGHVTATATYTGTAER
jgi:Raf kinase inhibitor-like YbhB/YbcL family protein